MMTERNQTHITSRNMQLEEELSFNKSSEDILREFESFFTTLVTSLNEVSRPEFCKIKVQK